MKGRSSAFAREGLMRTCNLICGILMFVVQSALEHLVIALVQFAFLSHSFAFFAFTHQRFANKCERMRKKCESSFADIAPKHQVKYANLQIAAFHSQIRIEVSRAR